MSALRFLAVVAALSFVSEPVWAADEVTPPKPLAGNKRIPYPTLANQEGIAGPVRFRLRVSAEGAVESVETVQVPAAGVGFEEAVREGVARWRFEPARSGGVAVPLTFEVELRFRLSPEAENAIDGVLADLQLAWNEDRIADMVALLDPTYLRRSGESDRWIPMDAGKARDWLAAHRGADAGGLELQLRSIRFLWAELAEVILQFRRTGPTPEAALGKGRVTAYLLKSENRWRIVRFGSHPFEPPPTNSPTRLRAGGEIVEPRKLRHERPVYPENAQRARIQGTVVLECDIDPEGKVTSADVIFGPEALVEAAVSAVRKWRYTPTLLDGKAVPVIMRVTVNFKIR
jgi:TonB family protein